MKFSLKRAVALAALPIMILACAKVPISGRKQLSLVSENEMMTMSFAQYTQFLQETPPVSDSDARAKQVAEIGHKLANAAEEYLKKHGAAKRVEGFQWEFKVVDDPTINAWCMPGGKVVVYTGIMELTQTDAGLAVVMGHEISHAIARHGSERMSQTMAVQAAGMSLDVLTSQNPGLTRNIFLQSFGMGSQLGMLKYSRTHETEADKMGLVFMAMAGYDPREAPKFWERMSQVGGEKPPEMVSTHPSDETRINDLNAYMPEALKHYHP